MVYVVNVLTSYTSFQVFIVAKMAQLLDEFKLQRSEDVGVPQFRKYQVKIFLCSVTWPEKRNIDDWDY